LVVTGFEEPGAVLVIGVADGVGDDPDGGVEGVDPEAKVLRIAGPLELRVEGEAGVFVEAEGALVKHIDGCGGGCVAPEGLAFGGLADGANEVVLVHDLEGVVEHLGEIAPCVLVEEEEELGVYFLESAVVRGDDGKGV